MWMSISRSKRIQYQFNGSLLTSFHVLSIFVNAAMHPPNLLVDSRKIASKVLTLISSSIFRNPERSSSADPNCCPWRRFLKCPNRKTRKSLRELSPPIKVDVDMVQFARNCRRKTLLSLLLYLALPCPDARPTSFHFSLHAEQRAQC
jgi:hypothetical protein